MRLITVERWIKKHPHCLPYWTAPATYEVLKGISDDSITSKKFNKAALESYKLFHHTYYIAQVIFEKFRLSGKWVEFGKSNVPNPRQHLRYCPSTSCPRVAIVNLTDLGVAPNEYMVPCPDCGTPFLRSAPMPLTNVIYRKILRVHYDYDTTTNI